MNKKSEFLEKLMEIVSNENYEFKLILGTINGKPVSTAAFLRLYDDLCGIYMVSTTEKAHKDEIIGVTLTEGLKKVKEYDMYLCFLNSVESEFELYNKVGFIPCDISKEEKQ
ncbi:hypothetical protein M918_07560 [Clostridium sp. BL8]|uniref:hypothetical protein n=1 Tax=Clostridium sp. BL8 TaxID=1354301 RepID=UPI00038A247E|nr:hypothetical protein [Clostridium sp. BL8]EQB87699.1 hypothetical protein M918_07560 [Clostridium sp. BL8]